jgi:hypothetical protein
MKLQCPKCRRMLPQIGNETLYPGDTVTCGLCLHVWTPIKLPAQPPTSRLETDGRDSSEGASAVPVTFTSNDQAHL